MNYSVDLETTPYGHFAEIYDRVMCSVAYEGWADYVEMLLEKYAKRPNTVEIIDLACGTGSSTLPFARRGYNTVGIDISREMLKQAEEKNLHQNLTARFFEKDLRYLDLPWKYDLALLFQDGFNYILSEKELYETFYDIFSLLKNRGLLIFDLTRPGLRCTDHKESISVAELEELTLIMESSYDTSQNLWTAKLTVFQLLKNGFYKKYQEQHQEKDHDPKVVSELLDRAGFSVRAVHPSFSFEPAGSIDQKLTFVAEKNSQKKRPKLIERGYYLDSEIIKKH